MNQMLRKPAAAFILACLLPALILSLTTLIPTSTLHYAHRTVIYSNDNVGEIMSAIENLKLQDTKVVTSNQHGASTVLDNYLYHCAAMTFGCAFIWAFVNSLHIGLKKVLKTEG